MAGPTCELLLESDDGPTLDAVDAVLAAVAERIDRTRKGRVWDVWIKNRPIHVSVGGSPPSVDLSAGCNSAEDYEILRLLAGKLAATLGAVASEPVK